MSALAAAVPWVTVPRLGNLQPYGMLVMLAVATSTFVAVGTRRRFGLVNNDIALIVPIAFAAGLVCGHVFDMVAYQLDGDLDNGAGRWLRLYDGLSLFGVLIGVALVVWMIGFARRLALAPLADWAVLACLVAMTIGRIGCAVTHDHLGAATTSVFGVDVPEAELRWRHLGAGVTRVHDTGLEELLALVPILAIAIWLAAKRVRPRAGVLAAFGAIAYAVVRFALDFLRLPEMEPRAVGLTAGQWCCLALFVCGVLGAAHAMTTARGSRNH